ncbi:MAG: hypothetical protein ACXVFV_01705 [Mycobacteriales bacterium]
MRRPLALLSTAAVTGGSLLALSPAQAATPSSQTVTASATKVVRAAWSGSVGVGADSGGCSTAVGGNDTETLMYKVPSGLYSTVTTTTVVTVKAAAGNDIDLLVTDAKGGVVGDSASGGGTESVSLTDLAPGTYSVEVCTGSVTGDSYSATLTTTPKARPSTATAATGPLMTFTPATVVDPVLFGGEPGFTFDPTSAGGGARSFVDWPVSSRTMIGVLFRSEDGGLSYTKRYAPATDLAAAGPACFARQVPYCPAGGGGDTDIDVNAATGSVSMGEQESLANQAVGVSLDHGTTFPADHVDPALDKTGAGVDRQWQASWKGTSTRFMAYHVPLVGEFVNRSDADGALGSWSTPAEPQIPGVTQSGSFVADNSGGPLNKTLYIGYIGAGALVPGAASGFAVGASTDGGASFTSHEIPGAASPRSFTTLSVDRGGNLYAAWVDSGTQQTYLATSLATDPVNLKAPATRWSKPVLVSRAPLHVTIFSNTVAGSPGRVAIGYYGTTAKAATPDAVLPGAGGWKPYVAVSTNALCQWSATPCKAPTFSQDPISHKVNHDTNICTSGTTCAASTTANRNLLDYFAIDVDKAGHLGFVWSDTDNATLEPFVKVARQASGPSLYAGGPAASLPQRGNGYPDALGDAKYPIAGASVLTAANQKALDLAGTTVQRAANGDVVVTMRVPGLSTGQGGVLPGGGTMLDASGTPLQQTRFVTRWDYRGQAYYAEATLTGTEGGTSYGAGTVSAAEGQFNGGNVSATLGNTYQPLAAATGTFPGGRIVIRVPAKEVGSPRAGDTLYSVGSYSLVGPIDTVGSVQALPLTVDSTPTMDLACGRSTAAVPGTAPARDLPPALPAGGTRAGARTAGLAATGLPAGLAASALALLGAGLLLRRRRTT